MLTFEQQAREIENVIIYADHSVSTHFYYMAPHPTIAKVGNRQMFDLYLYTVALEHSVLAGTEIPDELGAGFLNMGVECRIADFTLDTVRARLADQQNVAKEEITLAPIPYTKGDVRVIALDQMQDLDGAPGDANSDNRLQNRPKFVEQIIGGATPSLLGNLRSIFSLSLTQNGAAFLEGLYSQDAAPVGVVYDLEFYGLRPAVEVTIHANLSRIQKHFGAGLGGQYSWFKADISAGIDFLEETGDIKIEITSQMVGEEAEKSKKLALDLFKERIVQEMFKPSSPLREAQQAVSTATSVATGASSSMSNQSSGGAISLTLKVERSYENKFIKYDFSERMPEKRRHAPQAFLPLLMSEQALQERIQRVDLSNKFFQTIQVLTTGPTEQEFTDLGIRQVSANFSYEQVQQTLLFRPNSTGDKVFAASRGGRDSLAYTVQLTYDFLHNSGIDTDSFQYTLPVETHVGQSLLINPRRDFGSLNVEIEAGRIDVTVKQIDVVLHYTSDDGHFSAEELLRIDLPQITSSSWRVRTTEPIDPQYTAQVTYFFDDDTVWQAPETIRTEPLLRIDAPFSHERSLLIRPNVITDTFTEITLEVLYSDIDHGYERSFIVHLVPPFASTELCWPILDPNCQLIRYRETTFEQGITHEGEWIETEGGSVIPGLKNSRQVTVTVRLIGQNFEVAGIDALVVVLEQLDGEGNAFTRHDLFFATGEPMMQSVVFTIPPGDQLHYRWQTKKFAQDGITGVGDWVEEVGELLIISTTNL